MQKVWKDGQWRVRSFLWLFKHIECGIITQQCGMHNCSDWCSKCKQPSRTWKLWSLQQVRPPSVRQHQLLSLQHNSSSKENCIRQSILQTSSYHISNARIRRKPPGLMQIGSSRTHPRSASEAWTQMWKQSHTHITFMLMTWVKRVFLFLAC